MRVQQHATKLIQRAMTTMRCLSWSSAADQAFFGAYGLDRLMDSDRSVRLKAHAPSFGGSTGSRFSNGSCRFSWMATRSESVAIGSEFGLKRQRQNVRTGSGGAGGRIVPRDMENGGQKVPPMKDLPFRTVGGAEIKKLRTEQLFWVIGLFYSLCRPVEMNRSTAT